MHHNPAKNVLHVKHTLEAVAARAGKSRETAAELLSRAQARMLAARGERPAPFIDTTIYTNWNALAVSAYLEAAQVLRLPEAKAFALRTLDRLLGEGLHPERGLAHVISYSGSGETKWVAGMLDDYAFLTHACLDGWLATGAMKYYQAALALAERMTREFYDTTGGGFFDAAGPKFNPSPEAGVAGGLDGTAKAFAGFAGAGGESFRCRCVAASGSAERARGFAGEGGGYVAGVCRRGESLRAVRRDLWAGAGTAAAAAGAGGGDGRRCGRG
jgi:hypothetical protein